MPNAFLPQGTWPSLEGPQQRTTFLIYIDDSGDSSHDLLSALCLPVVTWAENLKDWKAFRKWLHKQLDLPPTVELHSERFLARGTMFATDPITGTDYEIPEKKAYGNGKVVTRAKSFNSALKVLGSFADARLFTCHSPQANGSAGLYEDVLLPWLEDWLSVEDSWGIVWYDGVDETLMERHRAAHRKLPFERRILEDAGHLRSHHSHFVQMADLCAHAAYKSIRADEGHESRTDVSSGYLRLASIIVPGLVDDEGFAGHSDPRGIRGYP